MANDTLRRCVLPLLIATFVPRTTNASDDVGRERVSFLQKALGSYWRLAATAEIERVREQRGFQGTTMFVPTSDGDGGPFSIIAVRYRTAEWAAKFREFFAGLDPNAFCEEDASKAPGLLSAHGWFDAANQVFWCQKRREYGAYGVASDLELWKHEGDGILMLEGLVFESKTRIRESDIFPAFAAYASRQTSAPPNKSAASAPALRDELAERAVKRLERDGWKEVRVLGWVRRKYDTWLVVEVDDMLTRRYATNVVPYALSERDLGKGRYWAKLNVLGGLDEIIDASGTEHSFRFSTWETVD